MTLLKDSEKRRGRQTPLSQSLLSINEKRVSLTRAARVDRFRPAKRRNDPRSTSPYLYFFLLSCPSSVCLLSLSLFLSSRLHLLNRLTATARAGSREGQATPPMNWFLHSVQTFMICIPGDVDRHASQFCPSAIRKKLVLMSWRDGGKFERACIDRPVLSFLIATPFNSQANFTKRKHQERNYFTLD